MREPLPTAEIDAETSASDPVAEAIRNADLAALWRAIAQLPRQQRDALLLREFGGLTYGELAGALAVSAPAVESLLFRARQGVRTRLEAAYAGLSGASWLESLARLAGGLGGGMAPVAAKVAAVGVAAVATGGAVVAPQFLGHPARARHATTPRRVAAPAPAPAPTPVAAFVERTPPAAAAAPAGRAAARQPDGSSRDGSSTGGDEPASTERRSTVSGQAEHEGASHATAFSGTGEHGGSSGSDTSELSRSSGGSSGEDSSRASTSSVSSDPSGDSHDGGSGEGSDGGHGSDGGDGGLVSATANPMITVAVPPAPMGVTTPAGDG